MADIRIKDLATTATSSASDDYLALDGSTNGTRKILATNVANNVTDVIFGASGPSAKSSIAARAARQGLVFDGTSNATLSVAGPGTGDFTHAIIVKTTQTSRAFTSGAPTAIVSLWVSSGGFAQVRNDGVAILLTGTKTINDGKSHYIVASRTGGTLFLYVDGVLDASVADSTNFSTATTYIGKDYSAGILLTGSVTPVGFYNRALSAAEVVSLYEAGVPAGADYNTASNTNAITTIARNSDFSAGATDWTGSSATATVTASKLDIVISTSGSRVYLDKTFITGWTAGYNKRWRLTADITNYSVSGGAVVQIVQGTTGAVSGTISANGAFSIELTNTNGNVANGQEIQIRNTGTTGTATLTIDNIVIVPIGLLLAPDAAQSGGGLTWYDTSGNAANITLPATGVTWNVPTSGYLTSSSSLNLRAGGTNQNITLTPSGTGSVDVFASASSLRQLRLGFDTVSCWNFGRDNVTTGALTLGTGAGTEVLRFLTSGRALLGTGGVDSGALLQIGTNTVAQTGGMVFGTDTFLFRSTAGTLTLNHAAGAVPLLTFQENGNTSGLVGTSSGTLFLDARSVGGTVQIRTNGTTTALTLDSSQNAKFAGNAVVGGGNAAGASTLTVNYSSATKEPIGIVNTNTGGKSWYVGDGTGTSNGNFGFRNATDSITTLIITSAGDGIFAGRIFPQQAVTASAPAYSKGAMYFDTTLNKLRIGGATAWETVTSV